MPGPPLTRNLRSTNKEYLIFNDLRLYVYLLILQLKFCSQWSNIYVESVFMKSPIITEAADTDSVTYCLWCRLIEVSLGVYIRF